MHCCCPETFVPRYHADVAIGAAVTLLLPAAWMRWRWAVLGLVAAFLLPLLRALMGQPLYTFYVPAWLVASILLLVTAWGTHKFVPGTLSKASRTYSYVFPVHSDLWRTHVVEVFDACIGGLTYALSSGFMLSIVCFFTGAVAAAVGNETAPGRGAFAAAILIAAALAMLPFEVVHGLWLPSLVLGVAGVVGAAWLGYLGGLRAQAVGWRLWLGGRGASAQTTQK